MTKITIFRNHDGEYLGFDCLGHAGYADEGEDIVCAGISALVINTINSIGLLPTNHARRMPTKTMARFACDLLHRPVTMPDC